MLKKRIIPCLDIKNGRTVKGVNFEEIRDAGDPVELAEHYARQGADELVFLDIAATIEKRKTLIALVEKVAATVNIPFTVGGGIRSVNDVEALVKVGADKISVNSAIVANPHLITQIADQFGSQCVVVAVDTQFVDQQWKVFTHGGKSSTALKTVEWAKRAEELGAGEILLTSISSDGTQGGFALDITAQVSNAVNIPVIASGGAGTKEHFKTLFEETRASAALAASVFHFNKISIPDLKKSLNGIVR